MINRSLLPLPPSAISNPDTAGPILWMSKAIRPFASDHDCQTRLRVVATARGSGPFSKTKFTVSQCAQCTLGFTDPIPTEETSPLLYETRESIDFQPDDSPFVSTLKALAARRDVRAFCRDVAVENTDVMLDMGCGNGAFVLAMQQVFPRAEVIGADRQPTPPSLLTKEQYRTYERMEELEGRCAFVLCRHVLEHTYDPVRLLKNLRKVLQPGGVIAIEVPSLETKMKAIFGEYWDGYYVPYHPLHFTRRSLRTVVESAGLSVIREGGAEMPKIGRSLRNLLGSQYGPGLFTVGMVLHPFQVLIGLFSGTSVCLRIWAR
jgi:precorrin-6B methylase 2